MTGPWTAEALAAAQDVADSRSLVAGTVLAMLMQYAENPDRFVAIDKVELVDDAAGNHQPIIRLGMRSGVSLLVIVAEDV